MASFQVLCEVVNEFAKNENPKIELENNDKNQNGLKELIENVLKNERLTSNLETVDQNLTKKSKKEDRKKNEKAKLVCSYCKTTWERSSALEKHLLVHTNVRLYECKLCMMNFKTKSNLYKHCKSKLHLSKIVDKKPNKTVTDISTPSISTSTQIIAPKISTISNCINNANRSSTCTDNTDIININSVNTTATAATTTTTNNNNNGKIMLLALPPGFIISFGTLKPIESTTNQIQPIVTITTSSIPLPAPSLPPITTNSIDLKHKKPQVINLDSLKRKILPTFTKITSTSQTTIKDNLTTSLNIQKQSNNNNNKFQLNDYINNLIIQNEYIKQNMPQLNKPKEIKNHYEINKSNAKTTLKNASTTSTPLTTITTTVNTTTAVTVTTTNNIKKYYPLYLDGHNYPLLNMLHSTFSFQYELNKNKTNNESCSQMISNDLKTNSNNLIYTISRSKMNTKLNIIHSSFNYGLKNVTKLDQYKNDVKNINHLVPLHNENLDKLVEPIFKDPNLIPKPLYQCGRKVNNNDHKYVKGRGNGRYECIECGIRTKKPSMLKKHIRTHANLRPYICKDCKISFKTKGNLVKHMKTKAHIKQINDNSSMNIITSENIDNAALKTQEEIEKRLIVKDDLNENHKNNLNIIKKRKLVDANNNFELDYFDSVQDVAKSLLNLSKVGCESFNKNMEDSLEESVVDRLMGNRELEDIGHLYEPSYKLKMCTKEWSLSISEIMTQYLKNKNENVVKNDRQT